MFRFYPMFGNDTSAYIPQWWANEALAILLENMVMGSLVSRDYEAQLADYGDTVNARRPRNFTAKRKASGSNVTVQDAIADKVSVKLDQHVHVSFALTDLELTLSMPTLMADFLRPAAIALANNIDQSLLGAAYRFAWNGYTNQVAGNLGAAVTKQDIIDLREGLSANKVPTENRYLVIPPAMEGNLLGISDFVAAYATGDAGNNTTIRTGQIGRLLGFNIFMSQNCPQVKTATAAATTTLTGAHAAGSTALTVGSSTGMVVGQFVTVAGDNTPQLITTVTDATHIVVYPGLKRAGTASGAVVAVQNGQIDLTAGYAAGWTEPMVIDTSTEIPPAGQLVATGTPGSGAVLYATTNDCNATRLVLNRNLSATLANNAVIGFGPNGNYGFAFDPLALMMVNRPMATPDPSTGVGSAVAAFKNVAIRITKTYDGNAQKHLVTLDTLFGWEVLDAARGALLLG